MKKNAILYLGCVACMRMACGGGKSDKQDSPAEDTTAVVQTAPDVQEKPAEPVKEEKVYYSPDLQMLDLKGDVVSCKFKGECDVFNNWESTTTFDTDGRIAKVDGKRLDFERDDQGRIVKYKYTDVDDMGESFPCFISYKYDEKGRLASSFSVNEYAEWTRKVKYDDAGTVVSYATTGPDGATNRVLVQKTDEKGNWIKRKCGGATETRVIEYRK